VPLEYPLTSKRPRAATTATRTVTSDLTTVFINLINVITVIVGPVVTMTTGINLIIVTTTAAMAEAMTIVATITTTSEMTEIVIAAMTSVEMIGVMIDVARTTIVAMTTTARSALHHHHLKGATLMVCSTQLTER
jgi:hypothetical protein